MFCIGQNVKFEGLTPLHDIPFLCAEDKSKRSGTLFCHIEFADTSCVDRAIRLSGASWFNREIRNRGEGKIEIQFLQIIGACQLLCTHFSRRLRSA